MKEQSHFDLPPPESGSESNAELLDHPYLLLDDPYSSGWVLRIAETAKAGADLLNSNDFTPFVHKEMAAMKEKFSAAFNKLQPAVGSTLYDGGQPVKSIYEIIGRKKYFEIMSRVFSKT